MSQRFLSALIVLSVVCYASAQSTCTATSGSNLTVTCANGTYPIFEAFANGDLSTTADNYQWYLNLLKPVDCSTSPYGANAAATEVNPANNNCFKLGDLSDMTWTRDDATAVLSVSITGGQSNPGCSGRATRVDFVCDAQQAGVLTSASEPESCDYVFKVSSSAACGKQPAPEGPCTASESLVVQCGERSFPMYKTFSSTLSITTTANVTAAWYLNLNTDVTRVECGADIRGAAAVQVVDGKACYKLADLRQMYWYSHAGSLLAKVTGGSEDCGRQITVKFVCSSQVGQLTQATEGIPGSCDYDLLVETEYAC